MMSLHGRTIYAQSSRPLTLTCEEELGNAAVDCNSTNVVASSVCCTQWKVESPILHRTSRSFLPHATYCEHRPEPRHLVAPFQPVLDVLVLHLVHVFDVALSGFRLLAGGLRDVHGRLIASVLHSSGCCTRTERFIQKLSYLPLPRPPQ